MDAKEQMKEFTEKFGAELAVKYFTEGLDMEQAISKYSDVLQERLKSADKLAAEKDTKVAELEKQLGEANDKATELAAKTEKVAELEKQLGETKTKLEVLEKQYGGLPYNELDKKGDDTTTASKSNAENEYAAELKAANAASGE
jgi:predicted RNase H-like nuclease (RuvC/YqgF family)